MNEKNLEKLINDALAIEQEDAMNAGTLGYMARSLVQATIPHSQVSGSEYKRKNGKFRLTILADSEVGIPYGSLPRLLMAWITTEAVKTKERQVILGKSLSSFMEKLDIVPTGGRWGSITRLKNQMQRLFSSSISCTYDDGQRWAIKNVSPVDQADLWWDPHSPSQIGLWESSLILGESFFNEIINHPVPIDMRALKALKKSPMALDIYCWITYRNSYLKKITTIPWIALQAQFGANYTDVRQFKRRFNDQIIKVLAVYPEARIQPTKEGLQIKPCKTHIGAQIK